MAKKFSRILYGGDYSPNQWPREIWDEDMRIFKNARINSATVNVFSWAKLQPSEERYEFAELDDIVGMLSRENYDIVLATSTAALPAWMFKRYPEVARTDYEGRHHRFGQRHNACPNSPVYRKYAAALAGKLAERYGSGRNIACWHINNEYGGECFCENCEKAFRVWLRKKYGTLEALNRAWNLEFWGHTVYDWDEIVLPDALGDGIGNNKTAFAGLSVDYRRFNSDSILETFKLERDAIRRYDPETPITTNLMGTYKGLDYFKWAKEMDIVSWDNYPACDTPWSAPAMCHDLMRGLKGKPFMLMEQTPSQQNWQKYNTLKRPGQMRAQSYQSIGHGADTIQFFQLRRSVGGCEKFHGAVIEHAGTDNTRVFREVKQLGGELERLGDSLLGSVNEAEAGIIFDWENYWALEYTSGPSADLTYVDQIRHYYDYFYKRNIGVDMIPYDADFSKYKVVAAPVLYMVKEGMEEALEEYVRNGGILILTYMSGIAGESDNVYTGGYPGPLRDLAGVWVEEIDAVPAGRSNGIRFADGTRSECRLVCDLMHLEGAESLACYTDDFYAGMPAAAKHQYGRGTVYYIGTLPDEQGLARLLGMAVKDGGVRPVAGETETDGEAGSVSGLDEPCGLEITCRRAEGCRYYFVINFTEEALAIPSCFAGRRDMLTDTQVAEGEMLPQYGVKIIRIDG